MRGLIPFGGLFGDAALDHFFDDVPTMYKGYSMPRVDIEEKDDSYVITADMPGFTKDQIHIGYENGVLSLSAKKEAENETKDDGKKYICRERSSSMFQRSFRVKGIREKDIKAGLKDGILTITLPKVSREVLEAEHRIEIE